MHIYENKILLKIVSIFYTFKKHFEQMSGGTLTFSETKLGFYKGRKAAPDITHHTVDIRAV